MEEESPLSKKKMAQTNFQHIKIKKKTNVSELFVITNLEKKSVSIQIKKYTKTHPDELFKTSYIQYEI